MNSWKDKGVHSFPKGISPKVNIIERLEFELAYSDSAFKHFIPYTTGTPPLFLVEEWMWLGEDTQVFMCVYVCVSASKCFGKYRKYAEIEREY